MHILPQLKNKAKSSIGSIKCELGDVCIEQRRWWPLLGGLEKASERSWQVRGGLAEATWNGEAQSQGRAHHQLPKKQSLAGPPISALPTSGPPTWLEGEKVLLDILMGEWKGRAGRRSGQQAGQQEARAAGWSPGRH